MSVINGTITGVTLMGANPGNGGANAKAFHLVANFAAYTGASDSATITGCLTAIAAAERNGKTLTLRAATRYHAGLDTAAQACYVDTAITLSNTTTSGDLAFDLANAAGTELTTSTACTGVGVIVVVDEA
jgi:hypothetical protein